MLADRVASLVACIRGGLRAIFRRADVERELEEELQSFLEAAEEAGRKRGLSRDEAQRAARLQLGGRDAVKEEVRSVGWEALPLNLARDVRFAARALAKSPGFASVAIATLAIAVGVNTAFFSAANSVLRRPLPYPHAERLMHIWAHWPGGQGNLPYPDYVAALERTHSFEGLAACENWGSVALTGEEMPVLLRTSFVTPSYLSLLGADAALGRLFRDDDNVAEGGHAVAVVSYGLWQKQFSGDPAIVGRVVRLNRMPFTVIGVLNRGFHGLGEVEDPLSPDVWLPTSMGRALLGQPSWTDQGFSIYWGLGLLKPGVTVEEARQDFAAVSRQLEEEQPATHRAHGLDLEPVSRYANGQLQRPILLLVSGAFLVLLIGCVNIASSLLARLSARRREMALRSALGASTGQLVRQLLVESGVLAAAGGAVGLVVAVGITQVLGRWARESVNPLVNLKVEGGMLVLAAVLSVGTMAALAVLPAWEVGRSKLSSAVAPGARGGVSAPQSRMQRMLVVAEVAFSILLLVGAGLMLRSFHELATSGLGFRTDHLLTFRLSLTGDKYGEPADRSRFANALVERVATLSAVESVSLAGPAMLGRATWVMSVFPEERAPRGPEDFVQVFRHSINPGALRNLGIAVLEGREFEAFDTAEAPRVAVISESVARELWPGESAVGKRLKRPDPTRPPVTVVGVAADARHRERYSLGDIAADWPLGGLGPQRDIYLPYTQLSNPDLTVAVRCRDGAESLGESLTETVASIDPDLPLADVRTLDDRLSDQNRAPAGITLLMGGYAATALFLAALGVYGVLSQSVQRRTQEIGVRVALGAKRREILSMVVGEGLSLVAWGIGTGLGAAWWLTRWMSKLLYGVSATDPATFAVVVPVLAAAALAACLIPARRALRLDPIESLRCD
jgi:putative ABC transport system permease protein